MDYSNIPLKMKNVINTYKDPIHLFNRIQSYIIFSENNKENDIYAIFHLYHKIPPFNTNDNKDLTDELVKIIFFSIQKINGFLVPVHEAIRCDFHDSYLFFRFLKILSEPNLSKGHDIYNILKTTPMINVPEHDKFSKNLSCTNRMYNIEKYDRSKAEGITLDEIKLLYFCNI